MRYRGGGRVERLACALRASLGPLADVRERIVELKAAPDAIDVPQARAALVAGVAADALDAGATPRGRRVQR